MRGREGKGQLPGQTGQAQQPWSRTGSRPCHVLEAQGTCLKSPARNIPPGWQESHHQASPVQKDQLWAPSPELRSKAYSGQHRPSHAVARPTGRLSTCSVLLATALEKLSLRVLVWTVGGSPTPESGSSRRPRQPELSSRESVVASCPRVRAHLRAQSPPDTFALP